MSLLSTASPYHSREDDKITKKTSNRRKATMSDSNMEAKNYMSQLIQNKEPQPSSHNSDYYSYQASGISDMLYPTLEDTSSKNLSNTIDENGVVGDFDKSGEEILHKNGALPSSSSAVEIPTFYKNTKKQQSGINSALQKLTGSKTITQEGMMDISSSTEQAPSMVSGGSGDYSPPYMPTMPAFTMNQMQGSGPDVFTPSPIDYLKSPHSSSSQNQFSDYLSSYSSSNYVVPPNLSQYSYPIMMRPSGVSSQNEGIPMDNMYPLEEDRNDRTQQLLLEKINYMIYLLEQQKKEKSKHTTEEFVLYSFLGVFVIYVADSFARSGRYIR
jgi:hypothetical protein